MKFLIFKSFCCLEIWICIGIELEIVASKSNWIEGLIKEIGNNKHNVQNYFERRIERITMSSFDEN